MGSSSATRAQRAAEQAERERQAQIRAATARIDQIFSSPERQAQYQDFVHALRDFYVQDANRQKAVADRNLRFALARSGLMGGSAAADAGRLLGEEYTRGILEAERRAQGALADLMSQDQQARLNVIQLAQSGLDATTAANQAAQAMRASLESARTASRAQGLGDIFGATSAVYRRQQEAAERRRGYEMPIGSLYGGPWGR